MAVDSYMTFQKYDKTWLASESQVDFGKASATEDPLGTPFVAGNVFEVTSFSFDVEQTLNLGSQAGGAGAGKVKFPGYTMERKIDKASPTFFEMACAGTTFDTVSLGFRKSAGVEAAGLFFLRFDFRFVAVESITWSHDEESPTESVKLQFGTLQVLYCPQKEDGSLLPKIGGGWDQIKNIRATPPAT